MKRIALIVGGLVLLVAVAIQFVPVDRSAPAGGTEFDAPQDVRAIVQRACFDCHSHETEWPWYGYVAPVSWWLAEHVEHARSEVNFSRWDALSEAERLHAMEEIREEVLEGEMPLPSYTRMHAEARLDEADKQRLTEWTRTGR